MQLRFLNIVVFCAIVGHICETAAHARSSCPVQELHFLWSAPVEAAVLLGLLSTLVHVWILPAVALVLAMVSVQYYFGFAIAKAKYKSMTYTNQRCAARSPQNIPGCARGQCAGAGSIASVCSVLAQQALLLNRAGHTRLTGTSAVAGMYAVP